MNIRQMGKMAVSLFIFNAIVGCTEQANTSSSGESLSEAKTVANELTDQQIENIVRRSYQYVAMYNVNNKFALAQGGWNSCHADTTLKDHTMRDIARPNNDTLYISCMLDLRKDPIILDIPAFDSSYVSLMVTGYDHYVNVPLSVTKGDFKKPEKVLFYSARTEEFDGGQVEGVDRNFEMTGDFVSAVFRVMPHAADSDRFGKIVKQMVAVNAQSLSEFQGRSAKPIDDVQFPNVGATDADVYANNFLQAMQFVVNHTSFDPDNSLDNMLLAAVKPLGIEPGKEFDESTAPKLDGDRFRAIVDDIRKKEFARTQDPQQMASLGTKLFKTKGNIDADALLMQSVIGPIGLPATEALYPPLITEDGSPMNALHDYVVRMSKDDLPPAKAFWSITLYDSANGFFIPNEQKKYSVGENGGMQLNAEGGIAIYIAASRPEGVPEANWLPINRKDEELDIIMRIYVPDLVAFKNYSPPKVEKLSPN